MKDAVQEVATLLAAGYLRLLAARAEKAHNDAVSHVKNPPNPLELSTPEWPCVSREDAPEAARR